MAGIEKIIKYRYFFDSIITKSMNFDFSQTIGIYGLGIEGKSLYTWLKKHGGVNIVVFDDQDPPEKIQKLSSMDIIFRSPGVHPTKILKHIGEENKQKISSTTELFFQISPSKNTIGITGTKGKGTTASLLTKILKTHFLGKNPQKNVFLGGNIGTPVFDFFDEITAEDIVVLELSSFQLYDVTFSPHIAVLLRTESEHLDWHSDTEDYRNAKKNIFLHQNKDDVLVYFGKSKGVHDMILTEKYKKRKKISVFSRDAQHYIEVESEKKIVGTVFSEQQNKNIEQEIFTSDIALRGDFHQENVLSAIAVAKEFSVPNTVIKKVLSEFSGLPMRCEEITSNKKIVTQKNLHFFNDSFSTIPETSLSAISTFRTPFFLILGGSEKNSDFTNLAQYIAMNTYIKKIYLIGQTAQKISEELSIHGFDEYIVVENLEKVFEDFAKNAQSGDSLLLSPGCASFGMFTNYKERGEVFNRLVDSF